MRFKRSLFLMCELYNRLRAEKIENYRLRGISLTLMYLRSKALEERRIIPELRQVHSQVVQNVADRVHAAFKNFLVGRARFPRNKEPRKYLSMTFPQSGFSQILGKALHLHGIGDVRIFVHRPPVGRVKRLTIKLEADEWYAIFVTEHEGPPKQSIDSIPPKRIKGIDLGLAKFATFDNGDQVDHPGFLRSTERQIKSLQRRLEHKEKGSRRWRKICLSLAKHHLHIKRQREDFQNKLVKRILSENDIIIMEKLNVSGMLKNRFLAKSISDASWADFAKIANHKANLLGKHFIAVDPWGTTQFCHNCLAWVSKRINERRHFCPNCGVKILRDLNSANLIKKLGIYSRPPSDGGSSPAEPKPLPSLRGMVSRGAEAGSH